MQKKKIPEATGEWQLQEAKNRLSRVVGEARRGRPQTITLRGDTGGRGGLLRPVSGADPLPPAAVGIFPRFAPRRS